MRRPISAALVGLFAVGCAGSDVTEPQAPPDPIASAPVSQAVTASAATALAAPNFGPALDDAIDRLVPALGPAGASIGQQLMQLRAAGGRDDQLLAAAQRKLVALTRSLPAAALPDADALSLTLDALRSAGM